jgi:hypothetical protein
MSIKSPEKMHPELICTILTGCPVKRVQYISERVEERNGRKERREMADKFETSPLYSIRSNSLRRMLKYKVIL